MEMQQLPRARANGFRFAVRGVAERKRHDLAGSYTCMVWVLIVGGLIQVQCLRNEPELTTRASGLMSPEVR